MMEIESTITISAELDATAFAKVYLYDSFTNLLYLSVDKGNSGSRHVHK